MVSDSIESETGGVSDHPASDNNEPEPLHFCGYPDGSFPCRIRHQSVRIGWGRAVDQ